MTASKRIVVWGSIALALFALHFAIEFTAWAFHPGNSASISHGSSVPWKIASFPLFLLLGNWDSVGLFWEAMVANSLIWSAILTVIAKRIFGAR